jgi:hypothetical protein
MPVQARAVVTLSAYLSGLHIASQTNKRREEERSEREGYGPGTKVSGEMGTENLAATYVFLPI